VPPPAGVAPLSCMIRGLILVVAPDRGDLIRGELRARVGGGMDDHSGQAFSDRGLFLFQREAGPVPLDTEVGRAFLAGLPFLFIPAFGCAQRGLLGLKTRQHRKIPPTRDQPRLIGLGGLLDLGQHRCQVGFSVPRR